MMKNCVFVLPLLLSMLRAQDVPPPPRPAGTKPPAVSAVKSRVDEVIAAVKAHVADAEIIDSLRADNKPIKLSLSDKTRLKSAGVSDDVIRAMQDPAAAEAPPPPAAAPAADQAPAPAQPANDNGPSLEATMKFIQDAMNGRGKIAWMVNSSFTSEGNRTTGTTRFDETISEAVADGRMCTLSYRLLETSNTGLLVATERDTLLVLSFRDVASITVRSARDFELDDSRKLYPDYELAYTPDIYVLLVKMTSGKSAHWWGTASVNGESSGLDNQLKETGKLLQFADADQAHRVAKAMVHAIELCGGGDKGPF
jgi:hypothetical protein